MYEGFFEARKAMQLPMEEQNLTELTQYYGKAIKEFIGTDEDVKKYLNWDYEIMSCHAKTMIVRGYQGDRLIAMLGFNNGKEWPDIKNFEKERLSFYAECVNQTENISLRVRYLDYLAEYSEDKYRYAQQLVEELVKICVVTDSDYFSFINRISRLINISLKFGFSEKLKTAEGILVDIINVLVQTKTFQWSFQLSDLIYELYSSNKVEKTSVDKIIQSLESAKDYYSAEKEMTPFQLASWQLLKWYKAEKRSSEDKEKVLIEIGQSFEQEADYQSGRTEKSNLVRVHFLEQAIQHYVNIGESDRIPAIKSELKKLYREIAESGEMQGFSAEIKIPTSDVQKEIDMFKGEDIEQSFKLFSRVSYFTPDLENIKRSTEEIYADAVISKIANVSSINHGMKVFQSSGQEDTFRHNFFNLYKLHLETKFQIMGVRLWEELLNEGLTVEMLVDRIVNWEYMNANSQILVEHGLRKVFEGDYISGIHILVPQFENCFRIFFEHGGYATTSIKANTVQHEQNFNDFLLNKFVEDNIEPNLLFLIKFVMVENSGLNLRNEIAHGLIKVSFINKRNCLIVLYLFFHLTNMGWKTPELNT